MSAKTIFLAFITTFFLSACGTLTGIPAHGGGKRFAVEQELVSASARAAVKDMDLHALQGRKVALYVSTMGDQGSGTISGGRYSIDALIRGEYSNNPVSTTNHDYPQYTTNANTTADGLNSTTQSTSILNSPSTSKTQTGKKTIRRTMGLTNNGMGEYRNETLMPNPKDTSYLNNLVQTVFFLRGIDVVPAQYADTDVFVNVDVFGTIRSRTELHLYNAETLRAQTKLEYFAVDRNNKQLLINPKVNAYEAAYREQYALWTGPYKIHKKLQKADGLMVDFSDIEPYGKGTNQ